jgi:hypothetical protein
MVQWNASRPGWPSSLFATVRSILCLITYELLIPDLDTMRAHTLFSIVIIFMAAFVCGAPFAPKEVAGRDSEAVGQWETRGSNAGVVKRRDDVVARRGLAASQARLLQLTAQKSDLELQLQFVSQSRKQLANTVSSLFSQLAKLDPKSAQSKQLQAQIKSIQAKDKQLESQSRQLDTQLQAVQTEIDALRKVV